MINTCIGLVGNPVRKKPLGKLRLTWRDNAKIVLKEVGCENMDWIYVAQDRIK
jgi:hypothetical protein